MSTKQNRPYGLWPSPVSPLMLGQRTRLENPQFDSDGRTLVWLEGRSDRGVLVALPEGEATLDLTDEQSVRARVGYGGGDFSVGGGKVIFIDSGGRLFSLALGFDRPQPLTPPHGQAASPVLSPNGEWVAYVWSDGKTDLIALVDGQGREWPVKLATGADFYMQPAWHPSGLMLAWVEWDHPHMPWDGTRLKLASLGGAPLHITEERAIDLAADCAVQQPQFSPDGRYLSFIAEDGEWDDLIVYDLANDEHFTLVKGDGFHLSTPAWVQGLRHHGWSSSSRQVYYLRNASGTASLWAADLETRQSRQIDTAPYTWLKDLSVSPAAEEVAFVASGPALPNRVVRWNGQKLSIAARSGSETLSPEYLCAPRDITWPAPDGTTVHALYYPPTHPDFYSDGLPPAIVNVHGGPTGSVLVSFNSNAAYFTTRGYAYVDLAYRGSTGYGRTYRNLLRERWGEVDVEDAVSCARALADQQLADGRRIVITGGSAGGYTVLNVLAHHPGVFKAGVCLFGVSNLFNLATDTHKFEQRYLDSMVGPLPQAAARYHAWSPIYHMDGLSDPMAVFQGKEDQVVPPDQAEDIVKVLRQKGIPHIYRLYEGEGHGWRKTETIIDCLEQTERFLRQQVLFSA
jgi:dipeptidyl aminopeptidase/acylaminoacyl peptidase